MSQLLQAMLGYGIVLKEDKDAEVSVSVPWDTDEHGYDPYGWWESVSGSDEIPFRVEYFLSASKAGILIASPRNFYLATNDPIEIEEDIPIKNDKRFKDFAARFFLQSQTVLASHSLLCLA